ncbi:MAG: prepilin-type N-terminal cleavage/methylation domain-containing protein [Alphaproteobacteria bacterium]
MHCDLGGATPGQSGIPAHTGDLRQAFTLVELAIVLVIIGLLVGGVLTGRDLIQSARINATVSDLQSYTAAAMTFRDKYGGIPGDLRYDKAAQAGLTISAVSPGATGEGDGDGILRDSDGVASVCPGGTANQFGLGGENVLFWRQLSDAGLIAFKSVADGTCLDTSSFLNNTAAEISTLKPLIPTLRLRDSGFVHTITIPSSGAGGNAPGNYYKLGQFTAGGSLTKGAIQSSPVMTTREALGIDQKMDDGFPATGAVYSNLTGASTTPFNGGSPVTSSDTLCYDNSTTAGSYAVAIDDNLRCSLFVRAGF